MLNKKTLMAGASAVAIFAAQAVMSGDAKALGGDPSSPWNGFYLGAHVGAFQANWDGIYEFTNSNEAVFFEDIDTTGIMAGVQVGYNMMYHNYLFGIEGDFTWMDKEGIAESPSDTEQATGEIDALYSIRGRLGVAPDADQRALLYVTAGVAWADAEATFYTSGRASTTRVNFDFDDVGGVVGGGVEWAASQSIRVRAEGLYYWFEDKADLFAVCGGNNNACSNANPGDFVEFDDVYVFRLGASYYFNAPAAPAHVSMK